MLARRSPWSAWCSRALAQTRELSRPAVLGHRELIITVMALVVATRMYQAGGVFDAAVAFAVHAPVVTLLRRAASPR